MQTAVVIPARFASSRFPGKPLVDVLGKSLICRTWEQCVKAVEAANVYVATDSDKIADHCVAFGAQVLMTPSTCLTGTDRVYHAAGQIEADAVVNVQGDEPLIEPADIHAVIEAAGSNPDAVINGMCPVLDEREFRSANVPKVLATPSGRLLYMSRAAVPTNKALDFVGAWRQVCVYAFPTSALEHFARYGRKTPLEEIEDIEILRFLELGYEVQMVELSGASLAVDEPGDVARVEAVLATHENRG